MTRIGSLCSGYGGLDLAAQAVTGGDVAWHFEVDPNASRILDHHWPHIPNHGDLTAVDWSTVEPVDVLTAGYPCQPFSTAGRRKGTNDDRHIWPHIADAIRVLRPRVAIFENVAGHVSLGFDTVLADLASLGFDVRWGTVRASDAGAPHRRERLFIVAADADNGGFSGREAGDQPAMEGRHGLPAIGVEGVSVATGSPGPVAVASHVGHERGRDTRDGRPGSTDGGLPTADAEGDEQREPAIIGPLRAEPGDGAAGTAWGPYGPAVARWEQITGRPAPAPTDDHNRLNPVFVEWMMGLPAGWVTDVPGLSRTAQLKALGNGVVPQQAELALRLLGLGA